MMHQVFSLSVAAVGSVTRYMRSKIQEKHLSSPAKNITNE
jgi:hypothetical protein